MTKKISMKPISIIAGATLAASAVALPAQADVNPFAMSTLSSGYMVADAKGSEGKCGEAKCGSNKAEDKATEAKCGEAKCGSNKAESKPIQEAKCGEGKCGSTK